MYTVSITAVLANSQHASKNGQAPACQSAWTGRAWCFGRHLCWTTESPVDCDARYWPTSKSLLNSVYRASVSLTEVILNRVREWVVSYRHISTIRSMPINCCFINNTVGFCNLLYKLELYQTFHSYSIKPRIVGQKDNSYYSYLAKQNSAAERDRICIEVSWIWFSNWTVVLTAAYNCSCCRSVTDVCSYSYMYLSCF